MLLTAVFAGHPLRITALLRFWDFTDLPTLLALENIDLYTMPVLLSNVCALNFSPLHSASQLCITADAGRVGFQCIRLDQPSQRG